jgi:hypothetical protein
VPAEKVLGHIARSKAGRAAVPEAVAALRLTPDAALAPAGSLRSLYCTAMRFEAAFFGEQPGLPPPPRIALLAVDFDETCTAGDTIGVIIDTAIEAAVERSGGEARWQYTYFMYDSTYLDSAPSTSFDVCTCGVPQIRSLSCSAAVTLRPWQLYVKA